jgi:hypothetical protein
MDVDIWELLRQTWQLFGCGCNPSCDLYIFLRSQSISAVQYNMCEIFVMSYFISIYNFGFYFCIEV